MPEMIQLNAAARDTLEELQLALREQQVILDTAGVGIVFIKNRLVVRCNHRFAEIFGHADAVAMTCSSSRSLYPDEPSARILADAAYPVMAQGRSFKSEVLMKRHQGARFWAHMTGKLVNPADPNEGSIWIIDDISEKKVAQAQLESLLHEQSLILDNAMVGIVFLRDRISTRCNQRFEVLLGYEPGELHGASSRTWYLSEQDWIDATHRCYDPLAAGKTFEEEMVLRKKDGSPVHCDVHAKAIDSNNLGLGSIWIGMDITARKEAETDFLQARAGLEKLVEIRTQELCRTVLALKNKAAEQEIAEA